MKGFAVEGRCVVGFRLYKKITWRFSQATNCKMFRKGCRMGRSDKVSLWYVALLMNTRFCFLF